jgi:flagellar M-ring protein FliF
MKSNCWKPASIRRRSSYIQEVEASIIKRVEDILAPIVGPGNARVQIAADIDFSQSEQTAETHRPNTHPSGDQHSQPADQRNRQHHPDRARRSRCPQQSTPGTGNGAADPARRAWRGPAAAGQPPVPGQINAAGVQAPIASVGQPLSTSKNSTINYEVDKTIRHVKPIGRHHQAPVGRSGGQSAQGNRQGRQERSTSRCPTPN